MLTTPVVVAASSICMHIFLLLTDAEFFLKNGPGLQDQKETIHFYFLGLMFTHEGCPKQNNSFQ
jgi:hypothetical protein